jgi:RND family efflux transporter MFP subunit
MHLTRWTGLVLVLLALGAAGACRRRAAADTGGPPLVAVSVEAARIQTLRDVASAAGVVVPASSGDLTVFAPDIATIAELPHKEQDTVVPGDLLVRFDIPSVTEQIAALQLDVLEKSSRLDRAKAEQSRQTSLFGRGLTSRNAYDASRAELTAADAALDSAQARLDAAQPDADRTAVHARFPGTVLRVWHAVGDAVRPGTDDPILRVVDLSRVQVSLQLPMGQLARVVPGQQATVLALGATAPEPAQVSLKPASSDPTAATGEVRLSFVQPTTLALDTPVSAEILLDQRTGALVVPTRAIARDGQGPFVMIVGGDSRAQRRDVQIGLITPEFAQVTRGLAAGERVVTSSLDDVADGMPVVQAR